MAKPYYKLYSGILDDYKIATLPDSLWLLTIKIGWLSCRIEWEPNFICSVGNIAEALDIPPETLLHALKELADRDLITSLQILHPLAENLVDNIVLWELPPYVSRFFGVGWELTYDAQWRHIRQEVLERDKSRCQYCGAQANHVDHIVPVCQGGPNTLTNLVAACHKCNIGKGGRTPEQAGMELLNGLPADTY